MNTLFTTSFVFAVLRAASPILLATMGSVVTERAGTSNIGVEGMMLGGAFAAAATSIATGSAWLGLAAGLSTGVILALVMAFAVIELDSDLIVSGFAINLFAAGFTVLLLSELFDSKGAVIRPDMDKLPTVDLPFLGDVPVLGALDGQNIMVWFALVSIAITFVLLFRTRFGLHVRAVGEDPGASLAAGVPVRRVKYMALTVGGVAAGLAGTNLSIGYLSGFTRDMAAGRGFIALAAALFGRRHPVGAAIAAILFGAADAAGTRLQGKGIPSQFVLMLPYVVTAAAVALVAIRSTRRRRTALTTVATQ